MTDGSYSIVLAFSPYFSQSATRNVGVFQFNTQNIPRHTVHRVHRRAYFQNENESEIAFIVCGHWVSPFQFIHLSIRHLCIFWSLSWMEFCVFHENSHNNNKKCLCRFFRLFHCYVVYLSKYKINKWTKSCLCMHTIHHIEWRLFVLIFFIFSLFGLVAFSIVIF